LSAKKLAQLELGDELSDAVSSGRAMTSAPARTRQMRQIRNLLRDIDWVQVRTRLDVLLETGVVPGLGAAPSDPVSDASLTWTLRLVGEGSAGIEAFVGEFPRADRTHLRQLVRAVHKASLRCRRDLARHAHACWHGHQRRTPAHGAALRVARRSLGPARGCRSRRAMGSAGGCETNARTARGRLR
jgi:Protein of unknown function (DUF615)